MTGARPPNILFIMADDLGYGDIGAFGCRDYATPNIDRLAHEGWKLTESYANSSLCSPTRVALMTGNYQYRLRVGLEEPLSVHVPPDGEVIGLPPGLPTLPLRLKELGYNTALIGKWHLGELPTYSPLKSGYDKFFGSYSGGVDYFTHKNYAGKPDIYDGELPVRASGYLTDVFGSEAAAYIEAQQASKAPFFLSLHFTAPHWPWEGPGDELESARIKSLLHFDGGSQRIFARMMESMDANIGKVLAALDRTGMADNTLVIFTSDNGGERFSNMWPFTGMKGELLEGGLRVPMLVRWPARLAGGRVSAQVNLTMDWMPTLLAAAGAPVESLANYDGENLLPVLLGESADLYRTVFWRFKAHEQRAMRCGTWKYLMLAGNEFVFNLANDPRERANLKDRHPQALRDMRERWLAWEREMMPTSLGWRTTYLSGRLYPDRYGVE